MTDHSSLTTAFFVASLAFFAKITTDAIDRFRERQSLASALAGEIIAYIELSRPRQMAETFRVLAHASSSDRRVALKSFGELPEGHPVFDKLAKKLGRLPPELAADVSRFYNIISGYRKIIMAFSSERFLGLPDDNQIAQLRFMASTLDEEIPRAQELARSLVGVSREWFFHP